MVHRLPLGPDYCRQVETEQRADGTLSDTPLPELLSAIAADGLTGVLRIDNGCEVWLRDGKTYLASTNNGADLSKVLFDSSIGTDAAIAAALDQAGSQTNGTGPTSALDQMLADNPESQAAVERILHEYNLNSMFEMLVPSDASYRFEPATEHPLGDRFAEDTGELVNKALQRLDIWRRIAARIPSTNAVFTLARALPEQADQRLVTADEWRFLSLLDGNNTVADLIHETGESAFRVCSSLYRMLLENLVEEASDSEST